MLYYFQYRNYNLQFKWKRDIDNEKSIEKSLSIISKLFIEKSIEESIKGFFWDEYFIAN